MADTAVHRAIRLLVVEDCPTTTASLCSLLRAWGHEVQAAADGPTALQEAARCIPDVVLLDIGLPGMDGWEVMAQLRQRPELRRTFVVAMTGHGQPLDHRRSQRAGCQLHLLKPIDPAVLQTLLDTFQRQAGLRSVKQTW